MQVGTTKSGEPIISQERCERCEGRGEVESLEHFLCRINKSYFLKELQEIVCLIDDGPPYIKLTEAIDRIHKLENTISEA